MRNKEDFLKELTIIINRYSVENESNTPDFILAEYLLGCLETYNINTLKRDKWWGHDPWSKYDKIE